jgi:adenosylmethionine-8-amino-7-oxononanoate aminotransferase
MSPSIADLPAPANVDDTTADALPKLRPTSILHRTPWRPPVAVSAQGIYITLENGQQLVDAAGGAAVTCLGHGHPKVVEAIREQAGKMSCELNN